MKKLLLIAICAVTSLAASAQQGFVRGKITDGETGEGLFGATVAKEGTSIGAVADFDGNYSLALEPGTHTLVISFVSFQTQRVENVVVKAGDVTSMDFQMTTDVVQLGEVVVTAAVTKDSDFGMMTFQRKSANLLDGASFQTFKKTGDSDLASAIKRVTGVSVQGGKFVYVRGLGDRYTRTTLNGMTIPGLDPDRNDVQIDIFPTSILENVIVYKTFSPNLPGDFTGGVVDVEMKNFPEKKTTTVSLGFGYNSKMNLNKDFLSYEGGKTDWLGIDDGTRELPFDRFTQIPDINNNNPALEYLTRSLNPNMAAERRKSFLNTTFTFNHGNQINREKYTVGYVAILNYQNKYEYYEGYEVSQYTKDDDASVTDLFAEERRVGDLGRYNVLWSALAAGSIKFDKHTIALSAFRTQNAVMDAIDRTTRNFDETGQTTSDDILTYSQRSVTNGIISGTHQLGKLRAEWKNSYTVARTYDPDFRATEISITDPQSPSIRRGDDAGISRFWRDLNENNENFKLDFTLPYGKSNKFQFGGAVLFKDRTFTIDNFIVDATQRSNVPVDPNYFLQPENIWTTEGGTGTYLQGNYEAPNNYDGRSSVLAGYVMSENVFGKLRAIYGVRMEKGDMYYTGVDIFNTVYDDTHTLDEINFLPSLNLVYGVTETMNIRASYGKTLARPSFKEKSTAQIFDPTMGIFFNGNINLQQTEIDNYDLRWENFFTGGDMLSVSLFYKQFDKHIEIVFYDLAINNVRPRNTGDSRVYGIEFEARKKFDFISPALSAFSIGANVTLANSQVYMKQVPVNDQGTTDYDARVFNAREGETVKSTRPMGGQSPYLINAYLNYADDEGVMNANLSYNVQGETLNIVGVAAVPDVYTQPFNSLNFNVYRNFGVNKNHRVTLRADNLLNAERRDLYKGYKDATGIYSIYKPGTTFTLNYAYTF